MSDTDDPFKPSDATVLRPRPGAGRRGSGDGPPVPPRPVAASYPAPIPSTLRDVLGPGLTPLVQAACPLVLLTGRLRGTLSAPEVGGLRRQTVDEIRHFEERALASGVPNEIVLAARYALCAALDEAVLSTPWGAQSEWAQQTLLVAFHREAWGGEKFFEVVDRVSKDPVRYIDLMELLYLCIAFGFAGKYQVSERGSTHLGDVQQDLYRKIRDQRGAPSRELSLHWKGVEDRRHRLIRYVPWWVVGAAALAVLVATFITYYSRLGDAAAPVHAALAQVGVEDFIVPRQAAPAAGPTLKQLLAVDEARGTLRVEEQGGRTLVTLVAPDLFASGSATVNVAYTDTLRRVANALNRVPGRVLVVGHTDDQPLRSLRYRDNFDLSRERAVGVVRLLQGAIDNPARIEWNGVGSSRPRFRPESDSENRARNRRVEIVHVPG
jgi:type VI secretion system protein ImpK